ncbi:MAG: DUF3489 domain-containing protein [Candidatus Nanopelagicales bacterium]|jgi:hypothetical protein|nr:DUF3489 domain-containing protein [Candidatus Nanopelagicales bacterium]
MPTQRPSTPCLNGNHGYCDDAFCNCTCHPGNQPDPDLFGEHPELPERPYLQEGKRSAGWSGTDTSRDAEPVRADSQKQVLAYVRSRYSAGATVAEVREATGLHHGVASGALSVLHQKRHLARLVEKRGRCRVYVHVDYVNDREQG